MLLVASHSDLGHIAMKQNDHWILDQSSVRHGTEVGCCQVGKACQVQQQVKLIETHLSQTARSKWTAVFR